LQKKSKAGLATAIGMCIHNVPEGIAVYVSCLRFFFSIKTFNITKNKKQFIYLLMGGAEAWMWD
jgi:zinc transporter ZupT